MHILTTILIVLVLMLALATLRVAASQSKYVYFPDRTVSSTPAEVGLGFEDLMLKTEDGETINAWFVPAPSSTSNAVTILFCHGNAGDIGDRIESLQTFNKLGFNTLIFDYHGYGKSSGTPSEDATLNDALACWDYLVDKRGIHPSDIVIFGRSLGGAVACQIAQHSNPRALVLESTFASVPDMAHAMFPYLPVRLFCRFNYDNTAAVRKLHMPILVAHSKTDRTCPYEQGRAVFEAAHQPKTFVEIQGDHNAGGLDTHPHYQKILKKFIEDAAK